MQLRTKLGAVELEHPLMNAAGCCKTLEQVRRFAGSPVSAIVVGSITVEQRLGNEGNVYWPDPDGGYALNALGLPNPGAEYYGEHLPEMVDIAHDADKPVVVSVAGFSPIEYRELTELAFRGGADLVELNLGCPNVWKDGEQKGIPSFYPDQVDDVLRVVRTEAMKRLVPWPLQWRLGLKLSPLSDPALLKEVARAIDDRVGYVATSNTFPNAFAADGNRSVLSVEYGGLSGRALKPIALGHVRQLRAELAQSVRVVGVGGVKNAADINDYMDAGATAVQAATVYWNAGEDPGVYGDVLADDR